jgi:hypothetical protein
MTEDFKRNALWVKVTDDMEAVGVGIYAVDPKTVADPVNGFMAEFLAGVRLSPEQAYEIAQRFTMCGIKIENARKGKGDGPTDGIITRDDGGV